MPRYPDELIERIKSEVLVETLARRAGVELKPHGENLVGLCPFHPDHKTPNLVITPAKNVFCCFACGAAGSPIDWVMRLEGVRIRVALEILLLEFFPIEARTLGIGAPPRKSTVPKLPAPFDAEASAEEIARGVVSYYHEKLKETPDALSFLSKRGIDTAEVIEHFQLGFSDRTLGIRIPLANRKAGSAIRTTLQELGFYRPTAREHFVGCVTFPLFDQAGNVAGMYGRRIDSHLPGDAPRHLYLPGPHRGVLNLAGFGESKEIILCEAPIDATTFWRWGFRNVTTAYGVEGFTDELLRAFVSRGIERCFIAYDRDEAGDRGAKKTAEKLMAQGVECLRVGFPRGMDANEYALKVQPGDKSLGALLRGAEWMGSGGSGTLPNGTPPSRGSTREAAQQPTRTAPAPTIAAKAAPEAEPPLAAEVEPERAAKEEKVITNSPEPASEACGARRVDQFPQAGPHSDPISSATEPLFEPSSPTPEASASSSGPTTPSPSVPVELTGDDEALFRFEDRSYRVRGLKKALQSGSLHVIVHAEREGDFFAPPSPISGSLLDRFDFVSALARSRFEKNAAHELGVKPEVVKWDLGQVLRRLEELQRQAREEALKPKSRVPAMTDEQRAEGLEYASAEDLIERILADYDRSGVVGEKTNKLVGYLGGVSRLSERPLAIIIRSSSAAGKTALMDSILRFVPKEAREKYSALSGHALFYFEGKDFKHKVLAIVEEEGAQRASYALKLLQSDGEITIASTGKDPSTGRLVTKEYRVEGPVMIFLCSTHVDIDEELLNRAVVLTVDEGREQTRAIHSLQRESQTLEGLWAKEEREVIYAKHHNFQRLLRPLPVVNPYVRELTFLDEKTRTRRDHTKYLGMIEASALLHQYQRLLKTDTKNGRSKEYVEVDLFDIALANRLASEVLGRTLDELGPQTRRFLMLLDEMVTTACQEHGIERSDFHFSRRDIRDFTGWTDFQVRVHLDRLVSLEYVLALRGGRGQTFVYELLYDGQGKDGTPFLIGLADVEALARARGIEAPQLPDIWPEEAEATPTLPTSRGETGYFEGSSSPQRAPIEPLSSPPPMTEEPASRAALLAFDPKLAENAHGGVAPKSYAQGGRSGTGAGQNAGRNDASRLRFNLLRFPPVPRTTAPTTTASATATPAVLVLPMPGGNGKKPHGGLVLRRAAGPLVTRTQRLTKGF